MDLDVAVNENCSAEGCWRSFLDSKQQKPNAFIKEWKIIVENRRDALKMKRSEIIKEVSTMVKEVVRDPIFTIICCVDAVAALYQYPAARESIAILLSSFTQNITCGVFGTQEGHLRKQMIVIALGPADYHLDLANISKEDIVAETTFSSGENFTKPHIRKFFFRLLCIFPDLKRLALPSSFVNTFFKELLDGSQYSLAQSCLMQYIDQLSIQSIVHMHDVLLKRKQYEHYELFISFILPWFKKQNTDLQWLMEIAQCCINFCTKKSNQNSLRLAISVADKFQFSFILKDLVYLSKKIKIESFVSKGKWKLAKQIITGSKSYQIELYEILKSNQMFIEAQEVFDEFMLNGFVMHVVDQKDITRQKLRDEDKYLSFDRTNIKIHVVNSLESLNYAASSLCLNTVEIGINSSDDARALPQTRSDKVMDKESCLFCSSQVDQLHSTTTPTTTITTHTTTITTTTPTTTTPPTTTPTTTTITGTTTNHEKGGCVSLSFQEVYSALGCGYFAVNSSLSCEKYLQNTAKHANSIVRTDATTSIELNANTSSSNSTTTLAPAACSNTLKAVAAAPCSSASNECCYSSCSTSTKMSDDSNRRYVCGKYKTIVGLDTEWFAEIYQQKKALGGAHILQVATFDQVFIFDFLSLDIADALSIDSFPSLLEATATPCGSSSKKNASKNVSRSSSLTSGRQHASEISKNSLRYQMARVIKELFSDPLILKLGWSFFDEDGKMIRAAADGAFAHVLDNASSFLDLRDVVDAENVNEVYFSLYASRESSSLSHACARYLSKPLSKAEQMSNWSSRPLTESQLTYASLDALSLIGMLAVMVMEINEVAGLHSADSLRCGSSNENIAPCDGTIHPSEFNAYTLDLEAISTQIQSMGRYLDQCYPKLPWRDHFARTMQMRADRTVTANHDNASHNKRDRKRSTSDGDHNADREYSDVITSDSLVEDSSLIDAMAAATVSDEGDDV